MSENLVIVESPAKAKTISRFLGRNYRVLASMGHVCDLPKSRMGIEVSNDFKPTYIIPVDKKKIVKQLQDALKKAKKLWIATDEDREGEAIGWHLLDALKVHSRKISAKRIAFHEITESAIKNALEHPRDIDQNLVDAQQARRVLDRLVGYELSPLLWKKIRYGLSAGRVQSVAVRLVVEREREIQAFKTEEYWSVSGLFEKDDKSLKKDEKTFSAELRDYKEKKIKVKNEKEAKDILKHLDKAEYKIGKIEEKSVTRTPAPPFITSTLQQEASRKLGFSVKKTMVVAQQLYEGVDTGSGETGIITYMRTDSVNLSEFALHAAKEIIAKDFGEKFLLDSPRRYKGRKGAQEAHEAIRPVDMHLHPDHARKFLSRDQARLYDLVWKRTIACQMKEALLERVSAEIEAHKASEHIATFVATGQTVKFPGFIEVYIEGRDLEEEEKQEGEKFLPKLVEDEKVLLEKLTDEQHFTKPPARYTEASLVKKLESEEIGRPSTYAPTISTIMTRGYIEKEGKALRPTDVAMVVTDMLVENFPNIVDYKFTAEMEVQLDEIEEGKRKWVPVIRDFYGPFNRSVKEKDKTLKKSDIVNEKTDEVCGKCGSKMIVKLGRFGKFLSCSNYPECKNAKPLKNGEMGHIGAEEKPLNHEQKLESEEVKELKKKFRGKKCEKCGADMEVKNGKYGPFLGCSKYPECKNIVSVTVFSGVKCPKCGGGQLVERRTRKGGRVFWGCNKFPRCKFATWDRPLENTKDGKGIVVEGRNGEKFTLGADGKKEE